MEILPPTQPQALANDSQIQTTRPFLPKELMGHIILQANNQPAVYIFDLTIDDSFGASHIPGIFTPAGCKVAFQPVCTPHPRNPASSSSSSAITTTTIKNSETNKQNAAVSPSPTVVTDEERGRYEPQSSKTIRNLHGVNRFFRAEVMRHLDFISVPTVTNSLNKVWFNPAVHIICVRHTHVHPSKIEGPYPKPWTKVNFSIEHLGFLNSNLSHQVLRVFGHVFPALQKLYSVVVDHHHQQQQQQQHVHDHEQPHRALPLEPIFQESHAELYSPVYLHMVRRYWHLNRRDILRIEAETSHRVDDGSGRPIKSFIRDAILEGLILR